eukprot:Sspe_Gene.65352::Locus_38697_Transcript_1_1_Confidence_1.000_Length_728::g.65352::m.65352/K07910/RAB18; Ras-related protein Rab-18
MAEFDMTFKLLLVGDSGVGKSSILLRFTEDVFEDDIGATIGVDFKVKYLNVKGKRLKLTVWDTAGQERFRTITSSYYRGAHGVILVYDVTDRESFDHLSTWLGEVESYKTFPNMVKLLVGNKLDLVNGSDARMDRAVPQALAEEFARDNGMMWIEVSAKTKEGILQAFSEMASKILDSDVCQPGQGRRGVNLGNRSGGQEKSGGMCC